MSEETVRAFKEPWSVGPTYTSGAREVISILNRLRIEVATVDYNPESSESYIAAKKANAERIVACVNVCQGIPLADLLRQPTVAQSVRPIGELVDAATEAMAYLIDDINEEGKGGNAHILYLRLEKAVKAMKGVQS